MTYLLPNPPTPVTATYVGPVNPETCAADTLQLWSYLPQFVQDADATNGYQFLTWLDGMGKQQQLVDDLCRDNQNFPGWSIIMDVSRCPTYALPWLGQFLGVRFNPLQIVSDAAMRAAISAQGNFGRGTVAAIKAAGAQFLGPGGYINVIERVPDPYSLTIQMVGTLIALTYRDLLADYGIYSNIIPGNPPYPALPTYQDFPGRNTSIVTGVMQSAIPAGLIATIDFI